MQHVAARVDDDTPGAGVIVGSGGRVEGNGNLTRSVRILAICDEVDPRLYGSGIEARRGQYDLLLSCGDLPAYYIDYVASMLSVPTYGVHGNHDGTLARRQRDDADGVSRADWGMEEIHGRVVEEQGLLIGGFDGSLRYNAGSYQYTESGMRAQIAVMLPQLLMNRVRRGRFLDILITHAPPRHIHDQEDRPHQGFEVFRWFLKTFRPRYHLHGHIHIYDKRTITRTRFYETEVLNVFPYRELTIPMAART